MAIRGDIPEQAKRLLTELWHKRYELGRGPSTELLSLVNPPLIARLLNLRYRESPEILDFGYQSYQPYAGLMDPTTRTVVIAQKNIPQVVQRYTALHEVAHWVLHRSLRKTLFRDFPLSGGERLHKNRDPIEREADIFAAYVLMPEQQLRADFQSYFGEPSFAGRAVDDDMRYWLSLGLKKTLTLSGLNTLRRLDLAEHFAVSWPWYGQRPESLCERYCVSRRAMAIQLIELKLI